jgi:hypothetical protein
VRFLGLGFVFDGASGFGREIRQRRMQFACVALCFPLTAAFGTVGRAWAVVIAGLVSHGLTFVFARRVLVSAQPGTVALCPK